jgi:hypothetical protein
VMLRLSTLVVSVALLSARADAQSASAAVPETGPEI